MLPTIVFILALFLSVISIVAFIQSARYTIKLTGVDLILLIINVLLWGWLYYLSH